MLTHFAGIRQLVKQRHQCDFGELERAISALEHDLRHALRHCHGRPDNRPASITLTVQ